MPPTTKDAAILVDLNYLRKSLRTKLKDKEPPQEKHYQFVVERCLKPDEYHFRTFFYDCYPIPVNEIRNNPISNLPGGDKNFFHKRTEELKNSAKSERAALRGGKLQMKGWRIKSKRLLNEAFKNAKNGETTIHLKAADIEPELYQKRVDMKIGLDVAWLASKRTVSKIILISGDTDFVPAMRHARREGVEVILINLGVNKVHHDLLEHSDEFREIDISAIYKL